MSEQPQKTSATKRVLLGCGCALMIFMFLAVGCSVLVTAVSNSSKSSNSAAPPGPDLTDEAEQTEAPESTATPSPINHHAERQKARDWWNNTIYKLAFANETVTIAKASIIQGDLVSASSTISDGSKYANDAKESAIDKPDGWEDVSSVLFASASDFADGLDNFRTYMDSQKPSDGAAAVEANQKARDELEQATHEARLRYVSLGGKWSDLDDIENDTESVDKVIRMLSK